LGRNDSNKQDTSAKKPPTSLFAELCAKVDAENPVQFRLPPEIRNFFTGGKCDSRID
jgi:hypothetical protein